jgi:Uma2 family endonuclease
MNALTKIHPPFTGDEFYRMAEGGAFRGMRVELRRGMILKMSPQHYPHGAVQGELLEALILALRQAGLPWRVMTGTTVSFGGGFEPMPDILVVDPAVPPTAKQTIAPEAVRLIVEVADSTLTDDMGEKREDYALGGLVEYWVADVKARTVIRHAEPKGSVFAVETPVPLAQPIAMLTRADVVARP